MAILIHRTAYTSLGCIVMQDLKEQCALPKWLTLYFYKVKVCMNLMVSMWQYLISHRLKIDLMHNLNLILLLNQ